MKKFNLLIVVLAAFQMLASAQNSSLIVYSEEGEPFTLTLNGKQINSEPLTRVTAEELNQPQYSAVVTFEDQSKGIIRKSIFMEPAKEVVFRVFMTNRGKRVMRLFSMQDISASPGQDKISQDVSPRPVPPVPSAGSEPASQPSVGAEMKVKEPASDRQETRMSLTLPDGSSMSVGIETTTTMTQSGGTVSTVTPSQSQPAVAAEPEPVVYVPGYTGKLGCPHPISDAEAKRIKQSIDAQSFSDTKMSTAKRALNNKCMKVSNIMDLMHSFSFEDDVIEFSKFAYDRAHDVDNFYQVYDVFKFSSSVDEVEQYIQSR